MSLTKALTSLKQHHQNKTGSQTDNTLFLMKSKILHKEIIAKLWVLLLAFWIVRYHATKFLIFNFSSTFKTRLPFLRKPEKTGFALVPSGRDIYCPEQWNRRKELTGA